MEITLGSEIEVKLTEEQIVDLIVMNDGLGPKLRTIESLTIHGSCELRVSRKLNEISIKGTCENTGMKLDFVQQIDLSQFNSFCGVKLEIPRIEEVRINMNPKYSFFGSFKKKPGPNGKFDVRAKISFFPVLPVIRITPSQLR